jgi:Circadian oscillating protein COP23
MNMQKIGQIFIWLLGLASVGGSGFVITNSFNNNNFSLFAKNTPPILVSTNKDTAPSNEYSCDPNGVDVVLNGKINSSERPVMGFNTTIWGKDYTKGMRCGMVKQALVNYNAHFITTGEKNGYSILCASHGPGKGCIKDANEGQIVTLGRTGINSQRYLNTLLVSLNPDPSKLEASAGFMQTEARVYIDLDKMITEGNNYTTYVTE